MGGDPKPINPAKHPVPLRKSKHVWTFQILCLQERLILEWWKTVWKLKNISDHTYRVAVSCPTHYEFARGIEMKFWEKSMKWMTLCRGINLDTIKDCKMSCRLDTTWKMSNGVQRIFRCGLNWLVVIDMKIQQGEYASLKWIAAWKDEGSSQPFRWKWKGGIGRVHAKL